MLGRGVAERLASAPPGSLVAADVVEITRAADLFVLNLECCISDRGQPWPDPQKPFFFRAPPCATELLSVLGVDCVTLANNHALDFGEEALLDTLEHLTAAGIARTGAGRTEDEARAPCTIAVGDFRLAVVAFSDHPQDFAARPGHPGIAYAELWASPTPAWIREAVADAGAAADAVLVSPHWGPNMAPAPVPHVRRAARELVDAGATLVAGHSAHVFHGVEGRVLFDLGDFLDDYAVSPALRNDLGILVVVDLDADGPTRLEAVPLALDHCHTRLATGDEAAWVRRRFREASEALGTEVTEEKGRLVVSYR